MKIRIKNKASPNSLDAIQEVDKLIAELKHLVHSYGQRDKPGWVDLTCTLERAKLVRKLILCRSDEKVDWIKVVHAIAFVIDVAIRLQQ